MKNKPLLSGILALLMAAPSAWAVSLTLGGDGPEGAAVRSDATGALYGSTVEGKAVRLTEINAEAPGGGIFTEIGVPSITPDGRVLFGAEVTDKDGHPHWDIFVGYPNAASDARVARALLIKNENKGCSAKLKGDPYPAGNEDGAFTFTAPEASGHDALFFYAKGELSCIARVGDQTTNGHLLSVMGFGTAQMGANGQVVFNGWLKGDRQAVLIGLAGGAATELAVEGELGPNRTRYQRPFGLPAALASAEGTIVAFTAKTPSGSALFLYRGGSMARVLPSGTLTPLGPVSYLSSGRPGLKADGTTAVLAGCARVPAILRLIHGRLDLSLHRGQMTPFGTAIVSLGDPSLTESGSMFIGAIDSIDQEKLYVLGNDDSFFEVGSSPIYNIAFGDPASHTIFTGTLAVNQHGDFAYLGGK